jgi:SAM-dependent methyltransferase
MFPPYDDIEDEFNQYLDESLDPGDPDMLYDLVASLALEPGSVAIDLGCGTGYYSLELARRFGMAVHGVDPDPAILETARADLPEPLSSLVNFVVGRAESIPLGDSSADLIWCRDVLTIVDSLDGSYAECRRVLRDGGHMIVYQMFATERLCEHEAAELFRDFGIQPGNMDTLRTEQAINSSGLRIDDCIDLGSEWGEFYEEAYGKAGRLLLHAARLLRAPERYVERYGEQNYATKYADCLWHVFRLVGKLCGRIYLLTAP